MYLIIQILTEAHTTHTLLSCKITIMLKFINLYCYNFRIRFILHRQRASKNMHEKILICKNIIKIPKKHLEKYYKMSIVYKAFPNK